MALAVSGPSLELRYATPGDAAALFALGRDPAVTRFFSWGPYERQAQALGYIESLPEKRDHGSLLDFLVVRRDDDHPIGVTGLSELSPRDRRATVGSWLGHSHWGSGANFEAKALITRLAFATLGLQRLNAYADTANGRSQSALERLGFRREGILRGWHRHGDRVRDVIIYGFPKTAWEQSALHEVPVAVSGDAPEKWVTG